MESETRKRILFAAGPIFAEQGFESTTIREICSAAHVNLAAVNYHFGSKEALYRSAVQLAHQMRLRQVPPPQWGPETSSEQKLRMFIESTLTRMLGAEDLGWQVRLLMREMIEPTGACQAITEEYIQPLLKQLLDILAELLPEGIEPHRQMQMAFSVIGQCLHYRVAREFVSILVSESERQAHYDIESLTNHITSFSLAGLQSVRQESEIVSTGGHSSQAPVEEPLR